MTKFQYTYVVFSHQGKRVNTQSERCSLITTMMNMNIRFFYKSGFSFFKLDY